MHSLIIFAHPHASSLTGSVAHRIAAQLTSGGDTAEVADLAAEGFDPRFTVADLAAAQGNGNVPSTIRFEQKRIERADALVLVFPVYWWSMPALLKGWVDRVFSYGWAYGDKPSGPVKGGAIAGHGIHLVALAGVDANTYQRRDYGFSMRVSIERGIFQYCETTVESWHFLYGTITGEELSTSTTVAEVVEQVVEAHANRECLPATDKGAACPPSHSARQ